MVQNAMARIPLWLLGLTSLGALGGCTLEDRVEGNDLYFIRGGADTDNDANPGEANNCDLSGAWRVELHTLNRALGDLLTAESHNWFYLEIEDEGDDITVARGWDCGFRVVNASEVILPPTTAAALGLRNRMDGGIDLSTSPALTGEPRRGIYRPVPDEEGSCEFFMERWWWVRGGDMSLLPARDAYSTTDIPTQEAAASIPAAGDSRAVDWEGDGTAGIWLEVFKPLSGQRHVVQRDWNEFGPFNVSDGSNEFVGMASFDNQETVQSTTHPLLEQVSTPRAEGHLVRFVRMEEPAPEGIEDYSYGPEDYSATEADLPADARNFVRWCINHVQDPFITERAEREESE